MRVMTDFWKYPAVLVCALALASQAAAQSTTETVGSAGVIDRGGIVTSGEVIFQDIQIQPTFNVAAGVAASDASANVTVLSSGGDAVSLAVPQTFSVIRDGGAETLTVLTTSTGGSATITGLESLISAGDILSVDVGGAINVSAGQLAPGEYRGFLVVVAQYN